MPATWQESSTRLGAGAFIYQVSSLIFCLLSSRHLSRWKYALFVAIDANFRLKRKAVSSDTADPSLNAGWVYFVQEHKYKFYIADRASEKQEASNMTLATICQVNCFFGSEAHV